MKNLTEMTDEELAIAYMNGDNVAFDLLLQRTKNGLFSYILFIVHDPEQANDLFQETFMKAITYMQSGRYSTSGKFNAWLVRIAHNTIMDNYRRLRNQYTVDNGEDNDLSNLASDNVLDISRESEFVNQQVLADVQNIMNFLPINQREVVYMRYFQNLSFKEIAETTGVSINTALGRMRYAIMNMRKLARINKIQLSMES